MSYYKKKMNINCRERSKSQPYCMFGLDASNAAIKELSGDEFKMWFLINKNQDNFKVIMNPKEFEKYGISKASYYRCFNKLVQLGYIVPVNNSKYDYEFYEDKLSQNETEGYQNDNSDLSQNETIKAKKSQNETIKAKKSQNETVEHSNEQAEKSQNETKSSAIQNTLSQNETKPSVIPERNIIYNTNNITDNTGVDFFCSPNGSQKKSTQRASSAMSYEVYYQQEDEMKDYFANPWLNA